jgi:hypothetical protein
MRDDWLWLAVAGAIFLHSSLSDAIGKALACEADTRFAWQLQQSIYEYKFPVINLSTEHDWQVLDWLRQCIEERKPVRACVTAKCLGTEL